MAVVGFGKHADVDTRRLLIQYPDYVSWALEQDQPKPQLAALVATLRRYIGILNGKPFVEQCTGKIRGVKCMHPVTRGTAYSSHSGINVDLVWWCDNCNPYQSGAVASLIDIRTYEDALSFVKRNGGRKLDFTEIIKDLSQAKGMPKRVTAAALEAFFGP
ncbi:hypothetical protein [Sorangium sp. So ce394]|uniref:hypothetical protein n=1 Tax=Sorangium sp. So ce394 TaxID=3133310 RepID=UPI003F5B3A2C